MFGIERGAATALGVSDKEFASIVRTAFERWKEADCGGGKSPAFEVGYVGPVDAEEQFTCEVKELNLDVWMLSSIKPFSSGTDDATAGVTHMRFLTSTGEYLDADVELEQALFENLDDESIRALLLTVATHEAGHALGLAHSGDFDALMYWKYEIRAGRELTPDDIRGICELFPPGPELECPVPGYAEAAISSEACDEATMHIDEASESSTGCAVQPAPGRSGWVFGLLSFAGVAMRRLERRRLTAP